MILPVKWTDYAKTALYTLIEFIAKQNPFAAEFLLQRIEHATRPIAQYPYIYRIGRIPGTREIVIHPNYIVVYQIKSNCIEILDVVHSHQEYPRSLA